jgi:2-polyprenyl-3-methyl-5-hydroxy-6-metoxy-1,4-benzoquinol methylase
MHDEQENSVSKLYEQSKPATGVLEITDLGARRQVTVSTNGHALRFETALSESLVRGIFVDKGPRWVKDSIDRFEDPEYVERPLARLIARFFKGTRKVRVLDIGCGSGASSAALARMGFHVIGIDPVEASVRIGTRAVQECGIGGRVTFFVGAGGALPIRTGSFDVVLLCAVIEHVPPECRLALLQEAWRALRPGGLLLIHDTPNRLWPHDGHTTGLWFVTWLPRRLALRYARRWSRVAPRGATDEELVSGGLCAPTYWEIRKALPQAICVNLETGDDVRFAFQPTDGKPRPIPRAIARRGIIALLRSIGWILRRTFGVPPTVVLQNLDLCFRKPDRLENAG